MDVQLALTWVKGPDRLYFWSDVTNSVRVEKAALSVGHNVDHVKIKSDNLEETRARFPSSEVALVLPWRKCSWFQRAKWVCIFYWFYLVILFSELFQRVIMLSGSALANWSFSNDPVTKTEFFTKQLGCPAKFNVTETIECLQSKSSWSDFVEIDMKMFANDFSPIWGPVLDGKVLSSDTKTGSPLQRMQSGEYFDYEVTSCSKHQS